MKNHRKPFLISVGIAMLGLILLSGILPAAMGTPPPLKPDEIPYGDYTYAIQFSEYEIEKMMKKYDLPSVAISIVDDQKTVYSNVKGFSEIQSNTYATLDTVYRVGSISKAFTAIGIMKLYEEGLVDIDAPITDYLPGFNVKNRFNDDTPITIRHILAHRSGLPRNGEILSWHWDSGVTNALRDLVGSVNNSYAAYPAGYRYKYSNFAFNLLAHIIEVVRGVPFFIVMQNEVFEPIGMYNTAYLSYLLDAQSQSAVGYYFDQDSKENVAYNQFDCIKLGSSNLYSTPKDMTTFMKWLFSDDTEPVLSKDILHEMFEDQYSKPEDPMTNGLGFFTHKSSSGEVAVFHDGTMDGTISSLVTVPNRKLGIFLTSNSEQFGEAYQFFVHELMEILLETKYRIHSNEESLSKTSVDSAQMSKFTGKFVFYDDIGTVELKRNKLKAKIYGFSVKLNPIAVSTFQAHHWLMDISFITMSFHEDFLFISIGGIDIKFCPKYPEYDASPENWALFTGEYRVYPRTPSSYTTDWNPPLKEIHVDDGILQMGEGDLYLMSISDTELVILSGPFDGEILERDPHTGYIYWQHLVYRPI